VNPAVTVVTMLVSLLFFPREVAGAAGTRHSPRPLRADGSCIARAHRAARMRGHTRSLRWRRSKMGTISVRADWFCARGRKIMARKYSKKGIRQGRTRDEGTQRRDLEERPLRAEGYKPQAGDRDRPFRSEGRRGEGPEKNRGQETQGQPKTEVEEVRNAFPVMPSSPGIAAFPLCPAMTLWPMQSCFHGFQ